jgi:NAD-dependent deacetylase
MVARLQHRYDATLITANIDDLHERASELEGHEAKVMHVHGRLTHMMCTARGCDPWDVGYRAVDPESERCPRCNSLKGVKPQVVFFGEPAPLYRAMFDAFKRLGRRDVILVIGTSGKVIDIGSVAAITEATTILSNLAPSDEIWMPGSPCIEDRQFDHVIHGRAVDTAPEIEALVHRLMAGEAVLPACEPLQPEPPGHGRGDDPRPSIVGP